MDPKINEDITTTEETTTEQEVKMIPESRLKNLVSQINAQNDELRKFREIQAQIEKESQAKADEEALKRGEYEKVVAAKDAELNETLNKLKQKDTEILKGQLERKLIDAGAIGKERQYTRDGMISAYLSTPEEERASEEDWLAALKEAAPSAFESSSVSVKTGNVGSIKNDTGTIYTKADLEDPMKAKAASKWVSDHVMKHGEMPHGWS